jgi:hypothetical protein
MDMIDDYMKKINIIHNLLISSDIIQKFCEKISQVGVDKYLLDIGSILYQNGKNIDNKILFPYDIYIKKGTMDDVYFKIAITFGIEENSRNYASQFSVSQSCNDPSNDPIKIRKGVILVGKGEYYCNKLCNINNNFMAWNTDFDMQTLKEKVNYWGPQLSYKEYYKIIGNDIDKIRKDNVYYQYDNIRLQLHHIDNNSNNNIFENLLWVTIEQHASLHLYMWEKYKLKDNFLKEPDYN